MTLTEYPVSPDEAPDHVGRSGFYCEHPATDRAGIPVDIDPDGMTVWEPIHLKGTDGSVEHTPTDDLEFWRQYEDDS